MVDEPSGGIGNTPKVENKIAKKLKTTQADISGFGDPIRVAILFLALFIGLVIGVYITLSIGDGFSKFHEIKWSLRTVILDVLDKQLKANGNQVTLSDAKNDSLLKMRSMLTSKTEIEANKILEKSESATIELLIPDNFFHNLEFQQQANYFVLTKPITVTYFIPNVDSPRISQSIFLTVKKYRSYFTFFNKYPSFGLFILLIIIQIGLYSVLCTGFIIHFWRGAADRSYNGLISLPNEVRWGVGLGLSLLIFLFIYMMVSGSGSTLNPDKMFMRSLNIPMGAINILGYIAALLSMGGMLLTMLHLNQLEKKKNETNIDELIRVRNAINHRFEIYFAFAATILTLGIFTTAVFFNAINSLEFIKVITKVWGYSPMNPELVYFYGILNSLILVLVYIPCKYTMSNINKKLTTEKDKNSQVVDGKERKELNLSSLLSTVTKVITVSSPFLASLLQSLLDLLFKK